MVPLSPFFIFFCDPLVNFHMSVRLSPFFFWFPYLFYELPLTLTFFFFLISLQAFFLYPLPSGALVYPYLVLIVFSDHVMSCSPRRRSSFTYTLYFQSSVPFSIECNCLPSCSHFFLFIVFSDPVVSIAVYVYASMPSVSLFWLSCQCNIIMSHYPLSYIITSFLISVFCSWSHNDASAA